MSPLEPRHPKDGRDRGALRSAGASRQLSRKPIRLLLWLALTIAPRPLVAAQTDAVALERPYLLPAAERSRLLELTTRAP